MAGASLSAPEWRAQAVRALYRRMTPLRALALASLARGGCNAPYGGLLVVLFGGLQQARIAHPRAVTQGRLEEELPLTLGCCRTCRGPPLGRIERDQRERR